jgi:hypothetical protein
MIQMFRSGASAKETKKRRKRKNREETRGLKRFFSALLSYEMCTVKYSAPFEKGKRMQYCLLELCLSNESLIMLRKGEVGAVGYGLG